MTFYFFSLACIFYKFPTSPQGRICPLPLPRIRHCFGHSRSPAKGNSVGLENFDQPRLNLHTLRQIVSPDFLFWLMLSHVYIQRWNWNTPRQRTLHSIQFTNLAGCQSSRFSRSFERRSIAFSRLSRSVVHFFGRHFVVCAISFQLTAPKPWIRRAMASANARILPTK